MAEKKGGVSKQRDGSEKNKDGGVVDQSGILDEVYKVFSEVKVTVSPNVDPTEAKGSGDSGVDFPTIINSQRKTPVQ